MTLRLIFFASSACLLAACTSPADSALPEIDTQSVNAVLGDLSYVNAFGELPTDGTAEELRLRTHLRYVETRLRSQKVDHLSAAQQQQRTIMLDLLNAYHTSGIFPRNYDYAGQRIPCFIDRDGRICAVGYLIEHTSGRSAAESINDRWQYAYLHEMNDPALDDWVVFSGLTREECAMIQPAYGPTPGYDNDYVDRNYAIGTSILTGVNGAMGAVNAIQLLTGETNQTAPIIGMVSGASQLTLGLARYPNEYIGFGGPVVHTTERNMSMLNIGLGAGTLVISTWNLLSNRERKPRATSWNLYSLPAPDQTMAVGISMTRRL